ncbi:MAG TPA: dienelactone hydrolase family protein [Polyangiaceae bacterium LLY-WYZ-14_1]|nr:dienelactone hydrolase family protein [Polyangiaceae bacterium LLY-WYZ-14_1]
MTQIELTAEDGHRLSTYLAEPSGGASPQGGLVVVQEIFGVNEHIREVTDGFARDGFLAIAPALFDRVERGVELDYDQEGFDRGRRLVGELPQEGLMADLAAARDRVAGAGPVGMVGYCFGGAVVWVAAGGLSGIARVVSYYGSRIASFEERAPKVPVMLHVGREDGSFPLEVVHRVQRRYPDLVTVHEYDAGHGFNCDRRADYVKEAADLARSRTLDFLRKS